jgi:hypothetical protein
MPLSENRIRPSLQVRPCHRPLRSRPAGPRPAISGCPRVVRANLMQSPGQRQPFINWRIAPVPRSQAESVSGRLAMQGPTGLDGRRVHLAMRPRPHAGAIPPGSRSMRPPPQASARIQLRGTAPLPRPQPILVGQLAMWGGEKVFRSQHHVRRIYFSRRIRAMQEGSTSRPEQVRAT